MGRVSWHLIEINGTSDLYLVTTCVYVETSAATSHKMYAEFSLSLYWMCIVKVSLRQVASLLPPPSLSQPHRRVHIESVV